MYGSVTHTLLLIGRLNIGRLANLEQQGKASYHQTKPRPNDDAKPMNLVLKELVVKVSSKALLKRKRAFTPPH